jgi:flavorubredoxin
MPITNSQSGTRIDEIADGIYRVHTPVQMPNGFQFNFNQFLILDDQPLLFHTGMRSLFPLVSEALATVMPVERMAYVSFSHAEPDESGALNEFLTAAPRAVPLCGGIGAMIAGDVSIRPPRALQDGETLNLGKRTVRWIDAPHVPHGWDCAFLAEDTTRTLFCGDLFTMPTAEGGPVVESDLLGPSEAFRKQMDYYSHGPNTRAVIEKMAALKPTTLMPMHGSAWRGDGEKLLRALANEVSPAGT